MSSHNPWGMLQEVVNWAQYGMKMHDNFTNQQNLEWAVERWNAEVKNRPMINVHRRTLDDAWRQVIRRFGGDPDKLLGPSHDELRSRITETEWAQMNKET